MTILNIPITSQTYQMRKDAYYHEHAKNSKVAQEMRERDAYLKCFLDTTEMDGNVGKKLLVLNSLLQIFPGEYLFQTAYLKNYLKYHQLDLDETPLEESFALALEKKLFEIAEGPEFFFAYINLGKLAKKKKEYQKAEMYFKRCLFFVAKKNIAYKQLIALYCEQGLYNHALYYLSLISTKEAQQKVTSYFKSYQNLALDVLGSQNQQKRKYLEYYKAAEINSDKKAFLKADKIVQNFKKGNLDTVEEAPSLSCTYSYPTTVFCFDKYLQILEQEKKAKKKVLSK